MNTETTAITKFNAAAQNVDQLFALEKITTNDLEGLDNPQRQELAKTITKKLAKLKGEQRDNFLAQIELVVPASTKSDIWEYNHSVITSAVSAFMQQYGVMPSKNTIAEETGLSRQTVAKHFNEYKRHPDFAGQMEQFQFMAPKMLSNVYRFALKGDMRAARLYFDMVGAQRPNNTAGSTQNNYIQINNTILSQQNLNQLTPGQLNQIESIINNTATKK